MGGGTSVRSAGPESYVAGNGGQPASPTTYFSSLGRCQPETIFEILNQDFTHIGKIDIAINQSEVANSLLTLKAMIGKLHLEEVDETTSIEGLEISYLSTR